MRQLLKRGMDDLAGIRPAPAALDEQDRKLLNWLNGFVERCYLAGQPVKPGMPLEGLRFRLEPVTDPDLEIP